jgi:hypothetical protein
MKLFIKFTLVLIIIFYSVDVYSQIEKPIKKGNITLGGDFNFNFSNNGSDTKYTNPLIGSYNHKSKVISLSLSPVFGYFILDGLILGLSPSFSYKYDKSISTYSSLNETWESKGHSYSIGLSAFVKYYFKSCIFIGLESGYTHLFNKNNIELLNNNTNNGFSVSPNFGYAIFINPKVSIEPSLNYQYNLNSSKSSTFEQDSFDNYFFLSVGFHCFL